jgi:hypothetical protein
VHRGRRRPALVPLAVVDLAVLAACGGSPPDGTAPEAVSISIGEPAAPLVPGDTMEESGAQVVDSLWTGLVEYAADGRVRYTGVAESVESSDDTTWTIRLREGWTFHDGSPSRNAAGWTPPRSGGRGDRPSPAAAVRGPGAGSAGSGPGQPAEGRRGGTGVETTNELIV